MTRRSEVHADDEGVLFVRCPRCGELLCGIQAGDEIVALAERAAEHEAEFHG
ncbi:hypothetical protein [Microbacterium sp. NPDC056052]|uniref:hypothetical protein n=1 Tax=Microbacterium sp. NPDC056052 TaxID=3345695 RepID=UPI0035E108BD